MVANIVTIIQRCHLSNFNLTSDFLKPRSGHFSWFSACLRPFSQSFMHFFRFFWHNWVPSLIFYKFPNSKISCKFYSLKDKSILLHLKLTQIELKQFILCNSQLASWLTTIPCWFLVTFKYMKVHCKAYHFCIIFTFVLSLLPKRGARVRTHKHSFCE